MNADGKMTRIFKKEYYIFRKEKLVLQSIKPLVLQRKI
nr:MAG TPA: hypothetical protein [Caudoviricetes sp.]